jgi:hypothetical protein
LFLVFSILQLTDKNCSLKTAQPLRKEPEIISIDEDEEDESMEDEGSYEDEEELENDEDQEDDNEDDEMDEAGRFYGDGAADSGSAFPVLEPNLKSVMGMSNRSQGL